MPKPKPSPVPMPKRPRTGWSSGPSKRSSELPKDWARRRKLVIARDGGKCVWCGAPGSHVDHIERGGNHELINLRLLCRSCHMRRTGRDGGRTDRVKRSHRKASRHPAYVSTDDDTSSGPKSARDERR